MHPTRRALVACLATLLLAGCGSLPGGAGATGTGAGATGTGAGAWLRLPEPPLSGRTGAVTVGLGDDRLLVLGGWELRCPPNADCAYPDLPLLADGAVLDLGARSWRRIADAPFGVRHAAATVVDADVYLLTGCRGGQACDGRLELLRYTPGTDAWEELGPVPEPAPPYATLAAVGDRLVVLADSDENGEHPDHLYDPGTDSWRELADDPLPMVYDRQVLADGDRMLVFGSPRVAPDQDSRVKVGAAYDLATGRWSRLPDAPGPGYQAWRVGDEVWLNPHFGSTGGGVLDLRSDEWRPFPHPPDRMGDIVDLAGVVGGGEAAYEYAAGWIRDTAADRWLEVPARPGDVYDESLAAVGDALVVFGGQRWDGPDGRLVSEAWIWRPPA